MNGKSGSVYDCPAEGWAQVIYRLGTAMCDRKLLVAATNNIPANKRVWDAK